MMAISEIIGVIQGKYVGLKICDNYFSYLASMNSNGEDSSDSVLFKKILSYVLSPHNPWVPFSPLLHFGISRTATLEDLSEEEIGLLEKFYGEIKDPELQARIADVLWLKKRNPIYAHDAIAAYLASAKDLRGEDFWVYQMDRIERALKFSTVLGKDFASDRDNVLGYIRGLFGTFDLEKEGYLPLRLTELLLETGCKDVDFCIPELEKCVSFFEEKGDLSIANDYLEWMAAFLEKKGDKVWADGKRVLIAENHVRLKESGGSSMVQAYELEQAIAIYRRIGGDSSKARVAELHRDLLEVQKGIPEEMATIETPVDISDIVQASIEYVSNRSKEEALFRFCFVAQPRKSKEAFDEVTEQTNRFIFTRLVTAKGVDRDGKTVSYRPGILDGAENTEEILYPYVVENLANHWHLKVVGRIQPALHQLMKEHYVEERDIEALVRNHPLVRQGHEYMFCQGLLHGLHGQFEKAAAILIPEFEDSLRYVLTKRGKITSSIENDFTQEERSTNTFFKNYQQDLKEVFWEDVYYELKAILVRDENWNGYNLRNSVAHGLMTLEDFYSAHVVYFWWLLFRIACMPAIASRKKKKKGF